MLITAYMAELHACGHIRLEIVARELNKLSKHHMCCKRDILFSDYFGTHVMIFQRQFTDVSLGKIMLAKKIGIKVIYELDDDFFNIPHGFAKPYEFYGKPEVQNLIVECMKNSDAITASTEPIAEAIRQKGVKTPIYVIDNGVDLECWDEAAKQIPNYAKPVIGWMASGSHTLDAPLIANAISRLMDEKPDLRLLFIGWIDYETLGQNMRRYADRIYIEPWRDIVDLPFAMQRMTIGLAPLLDNQFNRSKTSLKWMQYSALRIPCVASPVRPYSSVIAHGRNGFLCSENEWYDTLKKLVEDPVLCRNVGEQARADVAKYSIRNMAPCWLDVFERVLHGG